MLRNLAKRQQEPLLIFHVLLSHTVHDTGSSSNLSVYVLLAWIIGLSKFQFSLIFSFNLVYNLEGFVMANIFIALDYVVNPKVLMDMTIGSEIQKKKINFLNFVQGSPATHHCTKSRSLMCICNNIFMAFYGHSSPFCMTLTLKTALLSTVCLRG